ncbi:Urea active transporter-like protein [Gracilaria domingensis]|nr:Urea active transporter-like protein [Gracilaria domingensis]
MAVTSTGAAEQIAVSSLVAYDIYRTYINPNATGKQIIFVSRVAILVFGLLMGVLGIALNAIGVRLNFLYLFMGVMIGSAVIPVAFAISWSKCSGLAAISGALGGLAMGFTTWIVYGAADGGVSVKNLSRDPIMLAGDCAGGGGQKRGDQRGDRGGAGSRQQADHAVGRGTDAGAGGGVAAADAAGAGVLEGVLYFLGDYFVHLGNSGDGYHGDSAGVRELQHGGWGDEGEAGGEEHGRGVDHGDGQVGERHGGRIGDDCAQLGGVERVLRLFFFFLSFHTFFLFFVVQEVLD